VNKLQVQVDSADAGKIVEIELTRDHCEGIYAIAKVLGDGLPEAQQSIMSRMAELLRQVPKDFDGIVEVPFTAEMAASVLSLCTVAAKVQPAGAHTSWLLPLRESIGHALQRSGVRCKILVDTVPVFISP
jgi:hypothetical protein